MPIQVTCTCGNRFQVADQHAGRQFKCPRCGAVLTAPGGAAPSQPAYGQPAYGAQPPGGQPQSLQYAAPGAALNYATPPQGSLQPPYGLLDKFRRPGLPPCHLVFITQGADVNCQFDPSPALQSLANGFAVALKKQFDVYLVPPPHAGVPTAFVRIIAVDEGNRLLRYFLGIFFGATTYEVEGNVIGPRGQSTPFHFKQRGRIGMFGGDSLNLLKAGGVWLGKKVGKALLKA
jgi:hypothetical protein